jgi:hypothetical protein
MSDNEVYVAYGDNAADTATLLLASAEKKHDNQGLVRSVEGGFYVPKDVADDAGVDYDKGDDEDGSATEQDEKKAPAKKAATAKK